MERDRQSGQINKNMWEIMSMIKNMERVSLNGETDKDIRANGKTVNNMEKDLLSFLQENNKKVFGKMEKESLG